MMLMKVATGSVQDSRDNKAVGHLATIVILQDRGEKVDVAGNGSHNSRLQPLINRRPFRVAAEQIQRAAQGD